MTITLDELLGRNTQSASQESVERFPSYEDFKARNSANQYTQQSAQQGYRYNFDMAPAQAPRSVESVRNYEASRPYVAPQSCEYQTRDYPFYENLRQGRNEAYQAQPVDYAQYSAPVARVEQMPAQAPVQTNYGFYDFTAQDAERLSEQELFDKLAHTSARNDGPVFEEQAQAQRTGIFARKAQKVQNAGEQKQRARLNTKGKVILGVYLAVIAIVASLIIVNATKINQGKAVTPTSKTQASVQSANNTESFGIDSNYEVRI